MNRPRLAVFPKGYFDALCRGERPLYSWIDEAATLSVQGIEMYPDFYPATDAESLNRVYRYADARGLAIPMLCTSPDFTHPDPQYRHHQIAWMTAWIARMADAPSPDGFRSCRVLSGQNRPAIGSEDGISWTVEAIETLLPIAERHRIHLVMENHYKDGQWEYPEFAQGLERFTAIVNRIRSPWFGINYDPSNALVAGQDPLSVLRTFQDRVVTMHASDRHLKSGYNLANVMAFQGTGYPQALEHGVIGEGLIDYDAIFATLHDVGFAGWISIEDGVKGPQDLVKSASFLTEKLDHFFGQSRS